MIATTREGHQIYPHDHSLRALIASMSDTICAGCVFLGDLCPTRQRDKMKAVVRDVKRTWITKCDGYVRIER